MKNIIAISSLLAAGTVFASAETILTTTFSNAAQTEPFNVSLTNTWAVGLTFDAVTGEVPFVLGTTPDNFLSLQTSGAAGTDASFFSPNTDVGSGAPWRATFVYSGGVSNITTLDSISLSVGLFNASGDWQGPDASWTGNVTFTATIFNAWTAEELGSFTGKLRDSDGTSDDPIRGKGSEKFAVSLTGTTVDLSAESEFCVNLELTGTLDNSCFVGLQNIAYSDTVIPEPSAFGLLAGVGALALVAARRRRRAK